MIIMRALSVAALVFLLSAAVAYGQPAQVWKTGQTFSYAAGDDGALERGAAWPQPRFTEHPDGTVTDNLTGLMWLKHADCFGGMTWQEALNKVSDLNDNPGNYTCGGYTAVYRNWRLPNRKELRSLTDFSRHSPALPQGHPFLSVQSHLYWSSTTHAYDTDCAWLVYMVNGGVYSVSKPIYSYVWPVRAGPSGSFDHSIIATAGTGGTISPSGTVKVNSGESVTFTITAASGYQISDVKVNDISQGAIQKYTFSNVTQSHRISATFKVTDVDTIPPSTISNLSATTSGTPGAVILTWTAPGDDGDQGTAHHYEVKHHSQAITSANWNQATTYAQSWSPRSGGSAESRTVTGLVPNQRYYFCVKAVDEAGNKGGVSNSPSAKAGGELRVENGVNLQPSYHCNGKMDLGWKLMKQYPAIKSVRIMMDPSGYGIGVSDFTRWIREANENAYAVIAAYNVSDDKGKNSSSLLMKAADWWKINYNTLSSAGPFIINLMNEWGNHHLSAQDYAREYNNAIEVIREFYFGPIICDLSGWGQATHVAAEASNKINDDNIIFSVHIYPGAWNQKHNRNMLTSDLDYLENIGRRPVIVGEFGSEAADTGADWSSLVDHAKSKGWSVLAWAWNGDGPEPGRPIPMNMIQPFWGYYDPFSGNDGCKSPRDFEPIEHYFIRIYEKLSSSQPIVRNKVFVSGTTTEYNSSERMIFGPNILVEEGARLSITGPLIILKDGTAGTMTSAAEKCASGVIFNAKERSFVHIKASGPQSEIGKPSSITVPFSSSTGNYTVSWGTSSTSGVTYVLEEATNASFTAGKREAYRGPNTSASITGRPSGTTYYYRVKATKSGLTDSAWRTGGNGCVVESAPPTYILFDDFESYNVGTFPSAGGWAIKYNGAGNQYQYIADRYSKSGKNSFRLQGQASWGAQMIKQLSQTPDVVYFEGCFYSESVNDEGVFGLRNPNVGTWGTGIVDCRFYGGVVSVAGYQLAQYIPQQWYKVKVKADIAKGKVSAWLNDALVLDERQIEYTTVPYTHFALGAANDGTNIAFFDDVKVWKESESLIIGNREFRVTANPYEHTSNWVVAVHSEFGSDWGVADWTELKSTFGGTNERAHSLAQFIPGGTSLTVNGNKWWSGDRSYYIAPHYHSPPTNFLVHDHIQNYMVSLGSWPGTRRILAVRDLTPKAGTPSSITVPASSSTGSYTVSWGTSSTSGVTYVLEEATNASFTAGKREAYRGPNTSAPITGRLSGTTYYYRVKATKSGYTDSDWRRGDNGCEVGSGDTYTNSLGQTFVLLPAGTYTRGSPTNEPGRDFDETQHQVTLTKSFYMQTTEVTQAQWQAVMGSNPSRFSGCPNCPVEWVMWNEVQEFITRMNQRGEGTYRLPTEAEWEYAARAGTTTPFNTGACLSTSQANYDGNYPQGGCPSGEYRAKTVNVGSFAPNAWGLYDMHGNVAEWCQDWYGTYSSGSVTDPAGPSSGSNRVIRGGSWDDLARYCRSASRDYGWAPIEMMGKLGLRLARTP